MKLKKWLGMGLVAVGVLGSLGFAAKADAEEVDERVYISNSSLRYWINDSLSNNGENVENELPTVGQLNGLTGTFDGSVGDSSSYSLEGIQHMKNVKNFGLVLGGNIIDFRPLSDLSTVENFHFGHAHGEPWGPVADISFVENWQNLQQFTFDKVVFDLSPLDNADNLTYAHFSGSLGTVGAKQAISKANRELVMANPVTYSKHFGDDVLVDSYDNLEIEVKNSGDLFIIKDIPENTESITILISNQTNDWEADKSYSHLATYKIPLVWY
ncbi:hypothetical protein [Enterococcus sp. BWR-S5]|uniref:hypothetical protein n=1 Tax=Enterococcus sp. BWR-S5 TaxID=2787714 RepID=UPI001923B9F2|nr:hypothetical protein [Enterococcus sp. BWR-S5]MBL1225032.1 hypothetical protein [Enterococcus sp. BWR-S5]